MRVRLSDGGAITEVRPLRELGAVLRLAYGAQPADVVERCHRGLKRAAARLEAGDLAGGGIEAMSIGFPDLQPTSMRKLTWFSSLEKASTAWQTEPRLPAGQPGGGQWTTGGAADAGETPAATSSNARPPAQRPTLPPIDDGVYHRDTDRPTQVLTGGPDDATEGFRHGIGGNEPPYDFMELSDLFPGLRNEPGIAIPLAPIDSFLGISSVANQANLAASEAEYYKLYDQIRAMDPSFRYDLVEPLDQMPWQGRANAINDLLFARAAVYYRVSGDIRPLQVETLRFLQTRVDRAYERATQEYKDGQLKVPATQALAIGNRVDEIVREDLKDTLNARGVRFGPGQGIIVNNQDVSSEDQTYRRPDARLVNVAFDWSLTSKNFSTAQVRGFFRADSRPDVVIIIRPSRLGGQTVYAIARPPGSIRKVFLDDPSQRPPQYTNVFWRLIGEIGRHADVLSKVRGSNGWRSALDKSRR